MLERFDPVAEYMRLLENQHLLLLESEVFVVYVSELDKYDQCPDDQDN